MMPIPTERSVQRAIVQAIKLQFDAVVHHSPNGAYLSGSKTQRFMQAGALKGDGMLPGYPDLTVLWNGGGKLLEVKRPKRSVTSDDQKAAHGLLESVGWPVTIVKSVDDALAALRAAGAPTRGTAATNLPEVG